MGKSGFLPDVSSTFSFWREYSVNSLREQDFESAQAGLYNLNQCLTDEYVVKISSNDFEEQISDRTVFQCDHCTMEQKEIINKGEEDERLKVTTVPNEIHYARMKILERKLNTNETLLFSFSDNVEKIKIKNDYHTSSMDNLVKGFTTSTKNKNTIKYWICPDCNGDNYQKKGEWNTVKSVREMPFALGVIAEPPKRPKHLGNSLGFPERFSKWFYAFLEEIQSKMVLYRIEYVAQNGHDMTEPEYKDKGDHGHN